MSHPPDDTTPILVGVGQFTQKTAPQKALHAVAMLDKAARLALADTGAGGAMRAALDTLLVVASAIDSARTRARGIPLVANPPRRLARELGIAPQRQIYTHIGGDIPQYAVNRLARMIARGEAEAALIAGAEFLSTYPKLLETGADMSAWFEDLPEPDVMWGDPRDGTDDYEAAHGLGFPANTYPLIENAIRRARGRGVADHMAALGRLMSPLSRVAAANPHAWFPTFRTPEEIATPTEQNRMVGFPYTKYMNAIMRVDMAAALVMTSVGKAKALGIAREKWVFLHGGAEANDHWSLLERPRLDRSPAIRAIGRAALAQAGWTMNEVDYIDLYSCFPSALEVACTELGLAEDDPRGLTVTGGLPYFGGPGNNYATHAIATTVEKLRTQPGARGLVTANGWYVTKHAIGLYSAEPFAGRWERADMGRLQAEIDAGERVLVERAPLGRGTIESYTVIHARDTVRMAIILGRTETGARFLANTPADPALLRDLEARDPIGRAGVVGPSEDGKTNLFVLS